MGEMYENARNAELLIEHVRLRRATIHNPLSPHDGGGDDDEDGFFATDDDDDDDDEEQQGPREEDAAEGAGLAQAASQNDGGQRHHTSHSGSLRLPRGHESTHSGESRGFTPTQDGGATDASMNGVGDSTMRSVRFADSGSQRPSASGVFRKPGGPRRPRSASTRSHRNGDMSGSALNHDDDFNESTFLGAKSVRIVNGKAVIDGDDDGVNGAAASTQTGTPAGRIIRASPAGCSAASGEASRSVCIPMTNALLPRDGAGEEGRAGSFNMGGMFVPVNAHFERSGPLPVDSSLSPCADSPNGNPKRGSPGLRVTPRAAAASSAAAATGASSRRRTNDDDEDPGDDDDDLLACAMIKGESRPHFMHSRSHDGLPPLANSPRRSTGATSKASAHDFDEDDDAEEEGDRGTDTARPAAEDDIVEGPTDEADAAVAVAGKQQQEEEGAPAGGDGGSGLAFDDDDGVRCFDDAGPALVVDGAMYADDSDGSYELPDEPEPAAAAGFGGTAGALDMEA
jgi:hypothetical protein